MVEQTLRQISQDLANLEQFGVMVLVSTPQTKPNRAKENTIPEAKT